LIRNPDFKEFIKEKQWTVLSGHKSRFKYENFSYQEVLKELLPDGVEIPGGFETVGDIAHMNLNEG
jgi:tRNA (guanine37-N1)-methyltransferase